MRLKTCWLNKSVLWSDFKRFWYLGILNMLATFFFGVFPASNTIKQWSLTMEDSVWIEMPYALIGGYFFAIVFAVFATSRIFSYLNKSASCAFIHAMPLSRKTQFVSHISAAFLLSLTSGSINALLFFIYRLNPSMARISPYFSLKFLAVYLMYSLGAISLTAFAQMLTGSSIACLFFTGAFVVIPAAIEGFIKMFAENHIYGYHPIYENFFTAKLFYLTPEELLSWRCLIYLFLSLVLLTAAYLLYKKRPLECSGEVVAFRRLRTIFIYLVAVFAGMASYLYFGSLFTYQIFYLLPFGLLGLVIAFMISRKSFQLKGVQYPLLIFTAFVVLLYIAVRFDITGFERRLPAQENVEYIRIGEDDRSVADYYPERRTTMYGEEDYSDCYPVYYDDPFDASVYGTEDIKHYLDLHSYMSKKSHSTSGVNSPNYDEETDAYDDYRWMPIEYHLKNGRVMRRSYWVNKRRDKEYLSPVVTSAKYRAIFDELLDGTEKTVTSLSVTDERLGVFTGFERADYRQGIYKSDDESISRITQALIDDLLSVAYEDDTRLFDRADYPLTAIRITLEVPVHNERGEKEKPFRYEKTYDVWPFYTRTVAILEELGLYEALPTAQDILYMAVPLDENGKILETQYYPDENDMWDWKEHLIEETAEIEELYKDIDKSKGVFYHNEMKLTTVRIVYKNGRIIDRIYDVNDSDCPSVLKKIG